MTTQELIDYYTGLLILQYSAQPKATATIQAIIGELIQDQIIEKVRSGFDLDSAIGKQLNLLGTYRGANRTIFGIAPGNYWALPEYADPGAGAYFGWAEYAGTAPTWNFLQYNDLTSVPYVLTDNQLRRLIGLKAAFQSSSLGLADLDNILYSAFGPYVNVVDNKDMTIQYRHDHLDPDFDKLWSVAVTADALPHPAGVSFSVLEV